jgi:hypothetical protein
MIQAGTIPSGRHCVSVVEIGNGTPDKPVGKWADQSAANLKPPAKKKLENAVY